MASEELRCDVEKILLDLEETIETLHKKDLYQNPCFLPKKEERADFS